MAENNPDAVNPMDDSSCFYFHKSGRPGCIIGHVIASLGGGVGDVKSQTAPPSQMRELFADGRTVTFAETVQENADNGFSWLDAFRNAGGDELA